MAPRVLRTLLVASSSELGGAERSILNFVRYADPERVYPTVLTLLGSGPLALLVQQAGGGGVSWGLNGMRSPGLLRRMRHELMQQRYDLVHCFGLRADLLTRWVAQRLGIKVVSAIRSVDAWRGRLEVALDRLTADAVTAWISNSEAGKSSRVEREGFPAHRIFVVRSGIPDRPPAGPAERLNARKRFELAESAGPVLGMVAHLTRAKGHEDLIEALARLKDRMPGLVCLCAGRDDAAGRLRELAQRRRVDGLIRWLGPLRDSGPVYDAADFMILPSRWEGLPLGLIEALRAGLPSVATRVGGVQEIVRDGQEGRLVPPRDPEALAEAIERTWGDSAGRGRWGEAARRRYETAFRVETMVERWTTVYEALCGLRPAEAAR